MEGSQNHRKRFPWGGTQFHNWEGQESADQPAVIKSVASPLTVLPKPSTFPSLLGSIKEQNGILGLSSALMVTGSMSSEQCLTIHLWVAFTSHISLEFPYPLTQGAKGQGVDSVSVHT